MISILNNVEAERERSVKLIDLCQKRIGELPAGTLQGSTRNNNQNYYYRQHAGVRTYLGKSSVPAVRELMEKRFLAEILAKAENNKALTEEFLRRYQNTDPNAIYDALPARYRDPDSPVFGLLGSFSQERWKKEAVSDTSLFPDDLKILTPSGTRVRSKVEGDIFEKYRAWQVLFCYELKIIFPDGRVVDPDFTLFQGGIHLDELLQVPNLMDYVIKHCFFHEHFGKLHDPAYRKKQLRKLNTYFENGIYPGDRLLLTSDSPSGTDYTAIFGEMKSFLQYKVGCDTSSFLL